MHSNTLRCFLCGKTMVHNRWLRFKCETCSQCLARAREQLPATSMRPALTPTQQCLVAILQRRKVQAYMDVQVGGCQGESPVQARSLAMN